jgi:O-methyltransferase
MKHYRLNTLGKTLYHRYIRQHISQDLNRQRLKIAWFVGGYWPLLFMKALPLPQRPKLIWLFLRIDWFVIHGHRPSEIATVCRAIAERRARAGEAMVEAGCYNGGSSAKFSIACSLLGYHLYIYDSFEGVEQMTPEEQATGYDYSGEYAAPQEVVQNNLSKYGDAGICTLIKGWFRDTLASAPVPSPVRVAYIDCDLAKGTKEALQGILPSLVSDGSIFSQDYHIPPVIQMLSDANTWTSLGKQAPDLTQLGEKLVRIRFKESRTETLRQLSNSVSV